MINKSLNIKIENNLDDNNDGDDDDDEEDNDMIMIMTNVNFLLIVPEIRD
jgi:hypothetical protein